jgi:hypothetical protein
MARHSFVEVTFISRGSRRDRSGESFVWWVHHAWRALCRRELPYGCCILCINFQLMSWVGYLYMCRVYLYVWQPDIIVYGNEFIFSELCDNLLSHSDKVTILSWCACSEFVCCLLTKCYMYVVYCFEVQIYCHVLPKIHKKFVSVSPEILYQMCWSYGWIKCVNKLSFNFL